MWEWLKIWIIQLDTQTTNSNLSQSFIDFNVKVFTVASEETEGYLRFIRSANYYNVEVIKINTQLNSN